MQLRISKKSTIVTIFAIIFLSAIVSIWLYFAKEKQQDKTFSGARFVGYHFDIDWVM